MMKLKLEQKPDKTYLLTFYFRKSKAEVEIDLVEPDVMHVESKTDGYHWLHFWLSQNAGSETMVELDGDMERYKNKMVFDDIGVGYKAEDKETCFLTFPRPITIAEILRVAAIIQPRFALREKFFPKN